VTRSSTQFTTTFPDLTVVNFSMYGMRSTAQHKLSYIHKYNVRVLLLKSNQKFPTIVDTLARYASGQINLITGGTAKDFLCGLCVAEHVLASPPA
jgi:hypothetical protein